jgi:hypothetical protein
MSMSNLMGSFAGLKDVLRRLVMSNQAGLLPISAYVVSFHVRYMA